MIGTPVLWNSAHRCIMDPHDKRIDKSKAISEYLARGCESRATEEVLAWIRLEEHVSCLEAGNVDSSLSRREAKTWASFLM